MGVLMSLVITQEENQIQILKSPVSLIWSKQDNTIFLYEKRGSFYYYLVSGSQEKVLSYIRDLMTVENIFSL